MCVHTHTDGLNSGLELPEWRFSEWIRHIKKALRMMHRKEARW